MNHILRMATAIVIIIVSGSLQAQLKADAQAVASPPPAMPLPDSVLQLRKLADKAYRTKKYHAFVKIMGKLHQLRPLDTDYMYQLAIANALVDNKVGAYDLMLTLQRQGASYDFNATEDSKNIRGTEVYDYVNDLMVRAAEPGGKVEDVLVLHDDIVLPEAIDWDPLNKTFLIGTVTDGKLLRVDEKGKTTTIFQADGKNGVWSVFDIKVDPKRKIFWVSTAALPYFKPYQQQDFGRSSLLKFDLKSGKLLKKYPMALDGNPHSFANMALADDGSVYVADSQIPVIYVLKPGANSAEIFFASPELLSIRSLVLNQDQTYIYLSDYVKGLYIINLKEAKMKKPIMPETLNTSGIDGMYLWENSLIVIQNGFSPNRVLRLELDDLGVEIKDLAPVAVAQAVFDKPNFGVLRENWLYYFANSHWGKVREDGTVSQPVRIIRSRVDEVSNVVSPDLALFREQMKKHHLEKKAQESPNKIK